MEVEEVGLAVESGYVSSSFGGTMEPPADHRMMLMNRSRRVPSYLGTVDDLLPHGDSDMSLLSVGELTSANEEEDDDFYSEHYPDPDLSYMENMIKEWDFSNHEKLLYQKGIYIQTFLTLAVSLFVFVYVLANAAPNDDYRISFFMIWIYSAILFGMMALVVIYHSFLKPSRAFADLRGEQDREREMEKESLLAANRREERRARHSVQHSADERHNMHFNENVPRDDQEAGYEDLLEPDSSAFNEIATDSPSVVMDSSLVGKGNVVSLFALILNCVVHGGNIAARLANHSCNPFWTMSETTMGPGYCESVNAAVWASDLWIPCLFFFTYNFHFAKLDKMFFFGLALSKTLVVVLIQAFYGMRVYVITIDSVNYVTAFLVLGYLWWRKLSFYNSPLRRQLSLALYTIYMRYAFQIFVYTYIWIVTAVRASNNDATSNGFQPLDNATLSNSWFSSVIIWLWSVFPSSLALLSLVRIKKRKLDFWKKICSIVNVIVLCSLYCGFVATNAYMRINGRTYPGWFQLVAIWIGRLAYYTLPPLIFYQFYIGFRSVRTKLTTNNLNDLGLIPNLVPGHTKVLPILLAIVGGLHASAYFFFRVAQGNNHTPVSLATGIGIIILFTIIWLSYKFMDRLSASWFLRIHWLCLIPIMILLFFHVGLKTKSGRFLWTLVGLVAVFCVIERIAFTNFFKARLSTSKMIRSYLIFTLKLTGYSRFANSYKPGQTSIIYFSRGYRSDGNPNRKFFQENYKRVFSIADVRRVGKDVYLEYHITPVLSGTELLVENTSCFKFAVTRGFWGGFGRFLHRRGPALLYGNGVGAAPLIGLLRTEYYAHKAREETKRMLPFFCIISDRAPYIDFLMESLSADNYLDAHISDVMDAETLKKDRVILMLQTGRMTQWNELIMAIHERWAYSRTVAQVLGCGNCTNNFTPRFQEEICADIGIRHYFRPAKPDTTGLNVLYRCLITDPSQVREWTAIGENDHRSVFLFFTEKKTRKAVEEAAGAVCDHLWNERSSSREVWNSLTDAWEDSVTLEENAKKSKVGKTVGIILDPSEEASKHIYWMKHAWGRSRMRVVSGDGLQPPPPVISVLDFSHRLWPRASVLTEQ